MIEAVVRRLDQYY